MNLEERMKRYKETVQAELHEEGIQETIRKSKTAFLTAERERVLSYREFLWIQTKIIQKKWWVLQFLLLVTLWILLTSVTDEIYAKKSMGVMASLFVILMIPELD